MSRKMTGRLGAPAVRAVPDANRMKFPIEQSIANEISLHYHLTLEVMRSGCGSEYHVGSMAQVVHTALLLRRFCGQGVRTGLFRDAKDAILRCHRLGFEKGDWLADEEAYAILAEILNLLDHQLAIVPLSELQIVNTRLSNGSRANYATSQEQPV
ncbi:hypothetical protein CBA19CS22_13810 [Caballeronia novacaledonica]|uniref:Uncharacterized protein n=1 Tax=Caballeronia novacaledonica TaxID=1544861 RepID=A0ACB5QRR8_9BURK|nr:hypothetical protein CBA19CS22_13810 [Caballeronia novacaledonica]